MNDYESPDYMFATTCAYDLVWVTLRDCANEPGGRAVEMCVEMEDDEIGGIVQTPVVLRKKQARRLAAALLAWAEDV